MSSLWLTWTRRHCGAIMAPMMTARKDLRARLERFTVRLPTEMLEGVDAARAQRVGNVSRNTWIMEAVQEKLARSGAASAQTEAGEGS